MGITTKAKQRWNRTFPSSILLRERAERSGSWIYYREDEMERKVLTIKYYQTWEEKLVNFISTTQVHVYLHPLSSYTYFKKSIILIYIISSYQYKYTILNKTSINALEYCCTCIIWIVKTILLLREPSIGLLFSRWLISGSMYIRLTDITEQA